MNENNIRLVNSRTATFNLYFKQLIESTKQLQIYLYMDIYGFVYLQKIYYDCKKDIKANNQPLMATTQCH